MRVMTRGRLIRFWRRRPEAEQPLKAWHAEVSAAAWKSPADVRRRHATADFVAGNRVIFNIGGNNFRLVAKINYPARLVFICFLGTHREYDKVDAATVWEVEP
jgi:mRNA interferase HigB